MEEERAAAVAAIVVVKAAVEARAADGKARLAKKKDRDGKTKIRKIKPPVVETRSYLLPGGGMNDYE